MSPRNLTVSENAGNVDNQRYFFCGKKQGVVKLLTPSQCNPRHCLMCNVPFWENGPEGLHCQKKDCNSVFVNWYAKCGHYCCREHKQQSDFGDRCFCGSLSPFVGAKMSGFSLKVKKFNISVFF